MNNDKYLGLVGKVEDVILDYEKRGVVALMYRGPLLLTLVKELIAESRKRAVLNG